MVSLQYVSVCVSLNRLYVCRPCCILCMWIAFLQCAHACDYLSFLSKRRLYHIEYISMVSLQYVSFCFPLIVVKTCKSWCRVYICKVSLLSVSLCVLLIHLIDWNHCKHLNGFSPVCNFMCLFKLLYSKKVLSQFVHVNGFSPVCILIWIVILVDLVKYLLHFSHLCDFFSQWLFMCFF